MAQNVAHDQIYVGVDTHKDTHVGAVVDELGRLLDTQSFPTSNTGYENMQTWMNSLGTVTAVGIEGTGSYGAGLTRVLLRGGVVVKEINRPNRQLRRRYGKTDAVDAEAAARAVLADQNVGEPKSQDGVIEAIRLHRLMLAHVPQGTHSDDQHLAQCVNHRPR